MQSQVAHTQQIDSAAIEQLNDLRSFLSFRYTWVMRQFLNLDYKFIALFTGNQFGKTNGAIFQYVMRALGLHPVPRKNVLFFECENCGRAYSDTILRDLITSERGRNNLRPEDNVCRSCGGNIILHERKTTVFRLAAEVLPGEKGEKGKQVSAEVKNTLYPALKKWLPNFLIKNDITFRNPAMVVHNINKGINFGGIEYDGPDIVFEFMSYSQSTQAGAGVQRLSVYTDEEPPYDWYLEQLPRLVAEEGDFVMGLTPANNLSWTYDEIFERAEVYVRSKTVSDFLVSQGERGGQIEKTENKTGIAVIQAATDDNPTLNMDAIEDLYGKYEDDEVVATRRYGIHKQVKGRIFKNFDPKIHVYNPKERFCEDNGYLPPDTWVHVRLIDYHEAIPWAVTWMALSPDNEAFVYLDWAADASSLTTRVVGEEIATRSLPIRYRMNLIDPLAAKKQPNTGLSVIDDLNRYWAMFNRDGMCPGAVWEGWDTKSTRGREEIKKRLKNSIECVQPFSNEKRIRERMVNLPTIWISSECKEVIRSMRQWRYEEWLPGRTNVNKERKETPAQKFSHFCMCIEAAFKDVRFIPPSGRKSSNRPYRRFGGKR